MAPAIQLLTRGRLTSKNGNYDDSLAANTLVGMAVYEHGTAINDQTGVININVGTGQAFL